MPNIPECTLPPRHVNHTFLAVFWEETRLLFTKCLPSLASQTLSVPQHRSLSIREMEKGRLARLTLSYPSSEKLSTIVKPFLPPLPFPSLLRMSIKCKKNCARMEKTTTYNSFGKTLHKPRATSAVLKTLFGQSALNRVRRIHDVICLLLTHLYCTSARLNTYQCASIEE